MADISIKSKADLIMLLDRELGESNQVHGVKTIEALEKYALFFFDLGLKAGKLPENQMIFENVDSI